MKFEPTTLKVNDGPPCRLLFGDIASIAGGGFGAPCGAPATAATAAATTQ